MNNNTNNSNVVVLSCSHPKINNDNDDNNNNNNDNNNSNDDIIDEQQQQQHPYYIIHNDDNEQHHSNHHHHHHHSPLHHYPSASSKYDEKRDKRIRRSINDVTNNEKKECLLKQDDDMIQEESSIRNRQQQQQESPQQEQKQQQQQVLKTSPLYRLNSLLEWINIRLGLYRYLHVNPIIDTKWTIYIKRITTICLVLVLLFVILRFILIPIFVFIVSFIIHGHAQYSLLFHPFSSSSVKFIQQSKNTVRIAFIGNSITHVNDLPRLLESLSLNTIQQNSCLHSSLSFVTILSKGNGMYYKWRTPNAYITTTTTTTDSSSSTESTIYDLGACTVRQLLFGHDKFLSQSNENGHYKNDGMNPCFQDVNYYNYLNDQYYNNNNNNVNDDNSTSSTTTATAMEWDYVIMNDQTVQPGIKSRRKRSIRSLRRVYAKLFNRTSITAIPLLLSTYGYDKSIYANSNTDDDADIYSEEDENNASSSSDDDEEAGGGASSADDDDDDNNGNDSSSSSSDDGVYSALGDVSEFTSRIWYGYNVYAKTLRKLLPASQSPIIVPTALAFLLIYEENYNIWKQLFYDDGFHPSPHGTYLIGCCIYATIYQHMPPKPIVYIQQQHQQNQQGGMLSWFSTVWRNNSNTTIEVLYNRSRLMHTKSMNHNDRPYPTIKEAMYLYNIVNRIVLQKEQPKTLLSFDTIKQMEMDMN